MMLTPAPQGQERTLQQRLWFILRSFVVILIASAVVIPLIGGGVFITALIYPACTGIVDLSTQAFRVENITFPSTLNTAPTQGYFITGASPQNGATVIIAPTLGSGRGSRLEEWIHYQQAGYHILTFDSVNCTGQVQNSLGYGEVPLIGSSLDYLRTRADVDLDRVGIHGFSAGGALSLLAASQYPELGAVVAEGGYHDLFGEIQRNTDTFGIFGELFRFGVRVSYQTQVGFEIERLSPISVMDQIAPRPVLLVYGTIEPSFYAGELLAEAGGATAELYPVQGAVHGNYVRVQPIEYPARIVEFMDEALAPR